MTATSKTAPMALLSLAFCASHLYAQNAAVADGFYAYAPEIHVEVIRQESADSPACQGEFAPLECETGNGGVLFPGGLTLGIEAAGFIYYTGQVSGDVLDSTGTRIGIDGRTILRVRSDGSTEKIAVLLRQTCADPCPTQHPPTFSYGSPVLDVSNGRIVITAHAETFSSNGTRVGNYIGLIAITGLPTMFETLLTFTPGGTLSALVPGHPDGFQSADSLQVWTGPLGTMPDWSQAQPLTCAAATSPRPGELVTVADTLPDPAVGTGRYYITASMNGSDRRLGRQYVSGAYSARMPSSLPVCQEWQRTSLGEGRGSCTYDGARVTQARHMQRGSAVCL
jgi:hypothetical protein